MRLRLQFRRARESRVGIVEREIAAPPSSAADDEPRPKPMRRAQ